MAAIGDLVFEQQSVAAAGTLDLKPVTAGDEWMIRNLLIGGASDVAMVKGANVLTFRHGWTNSLEGLALPANQTVYPRLVNQSGAAAQLGCRGKITGVNVTAGAKGAIVSDVALINAASPTLLIQPGLTGGQSDEWQVLNLFADDLALFELTDGTLSVPITRDNAWMGSLENFSLNIRNDLYLKATWQGSGDVLVGYSGFVRDTGVASGILGASAGGISSVAGGASLDIRPAGTAQWAISTIIIHSPTVNDDR